MKTNLVLKTMNERSSGQGLIQSTLPVSSLLYCSICRQRYDNEHYPYMLCRSFHACCRKCLQSVVFNKSDLKNAKAAQKQRGCPQCQQRITKQTVRAFTPYYQFCVYIRNMEQMSKKQEMRYELKQIQSEQIVKMLRKENVELKRWIKEVSEKLRDIEVSKKWSTSKTSDFLFELPTGEGKNLPFEVVDGIVRKKSIGSFANVIGLQPLPKNGFYSFTVKLLSSLSGGSVLYGLCSSQAKEEKFPWLTEYFVGYSGNDGDVIADGAWSNSGTIHYEGRKVRAGDDITTIIDMNNKIVCWRVNNQALSDSYVIPQQIRNKLLFPIVVIQDGDRFQIVENRTK